MQLVPEKKSLPGRAHLQGRGLQEFRTEPSLRCPAQCGGQCLSASPRTGSTTLLRSSCQPVTVTVAVTVTVTVTKFGPFPFSPSNPTWNCFHPMRPQSSSFCLVDSCLNVYTSRANICTCLFVNPGMNKSDPSRKASIQSSVRFTSLMTDTRTSPLCFSARPAKLRPRMARKSRFA